MSLRNSPRRWCVLRHALCLLFAGSLLSDLGGSLRAQQVSPSGSPASVFPNQTGLQLSFTVTNLENFPQWVTFSCATTGAVSDCVAPQPFEMAPLGGQMVSVQFNSSNPGSGQVMLFASASFGSGDGWYDVTVQIPTYTVAVTPDGQAVSPSPFNTSVSQSFTITSTGNTGATYTLQATCAPPAAFLCSAPASVTLAAGGQTSVNVTYQSGPEGATGTVRLRASYSENPAVQDDGTVNVTVGAGGPATTRVTVADANAGTSATRALCLTIAASPEAAFECGDLRIVHALPGVRTMSTARAPSLLYNSRHAQAAPIVAAHVTLPAGAATPTKVTGELFVKNAVGAWVSRATGEWQGTSFAAGRPSRIALAYEAAGEGTKLADYRLDVVVWTGGTPQPMVSATGQFVLVDRSSSPFGAGWWLAGLERLYFPSDGSIVWVGGDGSTRRYVTAGTNLYAVAEPVSRPDTLVRQGDGTYWRKLPHGATTRFSSAGLHTSTVNRLGHTTSFTYRAGSDSLESITVPAWTGGTTYQFHYEAAQNRVRIVAPPAGGLSRETMLNQSGGVVLTIQDPDATAVSFEYDASPAQRRIKARTNRRGARTRFAYAAGHLLEYVRADSALNLAWRELRFAPIAEGEGLAVTGVQGPAPVADSVRTKYDGPRVAADVPDTLSVRTDRFGAPRKLVDATGKQTVLTRGDGRFPALVTEVRAPNGFRTWAMYDARGNIAVSTQANPLGDGRNAPTTYAWDQTWDFVKKITQPEGEITVLEYSTSDGNRLWQEDGRGSTARVSFEYHPSGLLHKVVYPGGIKDTLNYNALGNLAVVRSPMGFLTRYETDPIGRDTVIKTQINTAGTRWEEDSVRYDRMSRVTRTVKFGPDTGSYPAQRLIVRNEYDAEGAVRLVERQSLPDLPAGRPQIGLIITRWVIDTVGRWTVEVAPDAERDSTVFDPAGNAVAMHTRRRDASNNRYVINMTYDRLNRLTQRTVPAVQYPERWAGIANLLGLTGLFNAPYGNLTVPARTDVYTYDDADMGQLKTATNADAAIWREYYANGLLKKDSLFITNVSGSGSHKYGLEHRYDLNGRRTELLHPNQLAARQGTTVYDKALYSYDAATGFLKTVTEPLGGVFTYQYTARNELQSVTLPWSSAEQYTYDNDGRMATQVLGSPSGNLRSTTYQYDARGKLVLSVNTVMMKDSVIAAYSGLGHLIYSKYQATGVNQLNQTAVQEVRGTFLYDALGNSHDGQDFSTRTATTGWASSSSYTSSPRAADFQPGTGRITSNYIPNRTDSFIYDRAGNTEFSYTSSRNHSTSPVPPADDRASFYSADDRLWGADYRWVEGTTDPEAENARWRRVVETYRYDPLGRRVLVRALRTCDAQEPFACRMSTVRRTVWDGDRELYEIQMPGGESEPATWLENDTAYVNDRFDTWPQYFDHNPRFGRVAYTYGPEIDQPLSLVRIQFANHPFGKTFQQWGRFRVTPHWNYRGEADLGSIDNGLFNLEKTFPDGVRKLDPWWYSGAYAYQREHGIRDGWFGSLLESKEDGARTLFRRNRSYDPLTGRFTQEDPIGLAGGINLYGFAKGDPINFNDPFGLMTCDPPGSCKTGWIAAGTAVGTAGGALVAAGCAAGTSTVCLAGAPAIVTAGAGLGMAVGGLAGQIAEDAEVLAASASGLGAKIGRAVHRTIETVMIIWGALTGNEPPKKPDPDEHKPPPAAPTSSKSLVPDEQEEQRPR